MSTIQQQISGKDGWIKLKNEMINRIGTVASGVAVRYATTDTDNAPLVIGHNFNMPIMFSQEDNFHWVKVESNVNSTYIVAN